MEHNFAFHFPDGTIQQHIDMSFAIVGEYVKIRGGSLYKVKEVVHEYDQTEDGGLKLVIESVFLANPITEIV